ncbi:MAG: PD40 domain-containing protein, partial [Deltaproteobacteria bacterium]|nr:PD40 domain-containing protein [Deltaproteobacteria bacterium]
MPPHRLLVAVLLSAALLPREARGDEPAPFTPEDVWRLRRVSDPVPSPDGRWVAYSVTETDLAADARRTHLRLVGMDGAGDRRITWSSAGSDYAPAWSPDGRSLGFLSTRAGDAQVHLLPLADGGEARRVTDFPGGIGTFLLTPDGQGLVFAARTVPGCGADRECIRRTDDGRKRRRDTGQLHEHLLYRHWDTYEDGKVQHLFRQGLEPGAAMVDLTPDLARDALTFWLASAGREMDLSPDGRWLFFAGNQDPDRALSYDHQVFRVPLAGGAVEVVTANPAADMQPRVSPDGSTLAWRATRRPGYESDRFELMVAAVEGGEPRSLTPDTDLSVSDF